MIKEVKTVGAADAVVKQITDLIKSGYYKPNEKLPNEMRFMEMMNVGRSTVREAKRMLASMNLIDSHPGRGAFVKEVSAVSMINSDMFEMVISEDVDMLHEARIILETQMALLAMKRAKVEHIDNMQRTVDQLSQAIQNNAGVYEAGRAFHISLSEASQNTVLMKMNDMLNELLIKIQQPAYELNYNPDYEVEVHQNIVNAIREKDYLKVIFAMEQHFDYVGKIAKKLK
ncbi:hypothetical protein SY83_13450 [Paenibacillus swuensis]|uniref:HTH gntR-type domain-containing protein n=1 Tax=Paenibacillus swuensis TaxID=1178515 RepID=A0A172TJ58_9BACL|nr:FadR/GntR family transcriptional regulator [Paenibacillus swuensis]ANE47099.1 hypothetical protein SY83_13450 [Paenibacillus swuensis]